MNFTARYFRTAAIDTVLALLFLGFASPGYGAAGDLYVSVFGPGQNVVRITADGTKTPVTGTLNGPNGLAFDAKGVLYVSQYDGTIVKIVNGTATPFASGLATQSFNGLAFDRSGSLFVAPQTTVVRITPDGTKTDHASGLNSVSGLAIDRNDNIFVSDYGPSLGQGHIYKYTPTGRTTFDSGLRNPQGLAFDAAGNLYCSETSNNTIYKYTPTGTRTIFVHVSSPGFLTFDFAGNLIVATSNGTISKITPAGTVSPFTTTNSLGGITTEPALGKPVNISTRANVQTGDNALIGGFIATGTVTKKVMIRAIGPSLSNLGVPGALQDTTLEVRGPNGTVLGSNDNWKTNDQTNQSQQAAIQATGLAPTDDRESAVMLELAPNGFTAVVRGKNNMTGVGLVEVYDLNQTADSRLANISSRGIVGTDANVMIAGFIVGSGNGAAKVVARAIGPSLSALGISNALQDPTLQLRNANGAVVEVNDDWKLSNHFDSGDEVKTLGLAPANDRESAMLVTLPNGNYTVIVAGYNGGTGVGLVEVYNIQ